MNLTTENTRGRKAVPLTHEVNTINIKVGGVATPITFTLEVLPAEMKREDLEKLASASLKLKVRNFITSKLETCQSTQRTALTMFEGFRKALPKSFTDAQIDDMLAANGLSRTIPTIFNITASDLNVEADDE